MAIYTVNHHVAEALRFLAAPNKYVGIGRNITAWPDDNAPPAPAPDVSSLTEPIGYKPIAMATLVVPDAAGTLEAGGQTWRAVDSAAAFTAGAVHVYMECSLDYGELPLVTYREVAIFTGLTKAPAAGIGALLPADVTDPGVLEFIDYRKPEPRAADKRDHIALVQRF